MVNLYIVNPAHKLRFVSRLISRGAKRIFLGNVVAAPSQSPPPAAKIRIPDHDHDDDDDVVLEEKRPPKINVLDLIKKDLPPVPRGGLTRSAEYYKDESEGRFVVFRVDDTLFKVHKCYLLREPSAFGDMFSLPVIEGNREGWSDDAPIPLSDTAEQFQDLLWVLYAIPSQLVSTSDSDSPSLEKLLNIAELTNKYCIASYESWALERILSLAQNPVGFLRHAPATICARALNIAALSNHKRLLDTITHRLVARMLWSDVDRQPILDVAQARGLRKIQGVAYFKELVDLEKMSFDVDGYTTTTRPIFPPSMSVEKRMRFLAAHHSLVNLWECIRTTPPVFVEDGCAASQHAECLTAWTDLWVGAAEANQTLRHGSADVLGRLKSMMIVLKKTMMESGSMSLGCVLGALEAITATRDDIVAGLMDHFQEEY